MIDVVKLRWLTLLISALGLIALLLGSYQIIVANRSLAWPSTLGKVARAYVAPYGGNARGYYRTVVTYTYEVGGRIYQSHQLAIVESYTNQLNEAQAMVSHFSSGSTVTVYYNPDDPSNAVLMPGLHGTIWSKYATMLIGGFMLGIGIVARLLGKTL